MKSDFEVMSEMSEKDQNIRMSNTLVETKTVSQGGLISMGVDRQTLLDVTMNPEKYVIGLYVMDKSQFDKIKEPVKQNI